MSDSISSGRRPSRSLVHLWTVVGLIVILAYVLDLMISTSTSHPVSLGNAHGDLLIMGSEWTVVIALAIVSFGFQRRHPGFFGLRMPGWRDILTMLAFLVLSAILVVGLFMIPEIRHQLAAFSSHQQHLTAAPFDVRLGLVLTAGICEEAIFRGYLIEQIRDWTGFTSVGALVSLILFTLPHAWIYGFGPALLIPAVLGGSLIGLYVLRRNLPVCMLMHALIDGYFILLVPILMHAHGG